MWLIKLKILNFTSNSDLIISILFEFVIYTLCAEINNFLFSRLQFIFRRKMDAEVAYNDLLDKYSKLDLFPVASFQTLKADALKIAWDILLTLFLKCVFSPCLYGDCSRNLRPADIWFN